MPVTPAWLSAATGATEIGQLCPNGEEHAPGEAFAINDRAQVVGETAIGGCLFAAHHAFLYSGGTLQDLGTLGGGESAARAIDNLGGTIVGYARVKANNCGSFGEPSCPLHAFSYRNGKMTDLGTLPGADESKAYGVNDLGLIVGTSGGHAFLDFMGSMFDLNSLIPANSRWTLTEARGMNDRGEIVGTGLHNGIERGFILKPRWLWLLRTGWTRSDRCAESPQ